VLNEPENPGTEFSKYLAFLLMNATNTLVIYLTHIAKAIMLLREYDKQDLKKARWLSAVIITTIAPAFIMTLN